jgi:catechol 2,3-dioxygenase-like lactoylglutathione lyase family enzyme
MRLRQIALVARNLDAARADIASVFGLDYAYADPAVGRYGLDNAVFPVGDTFLEVVSPVVEGTTAGRLLEKRRGDGGYMVILQTDRLGEARDRVRADGVRIVDQKDGDGVAFTHLHPRDVSGAILSIDYMNPPKRWDWGGPHWREHINRDRVLLIRGAELQAEAPDRMAARWAEVLGCCADRSGESWRIGLRDGELRFTALQDERGEGLRAFDVVASNAKAIRDAAVRRSLINAQGFVTLCGTSIHLMSPQQSPPSWPDRNIPPTSPPQWPLPVSV